MKIVVIWSRFGPYHLARLKGAAEASPADEVVGLEVAGLDRQYEWDRVEGADGFGRVTVFENANYHDLSSRQIAQGVSAALDRIAPDVVAANGWSVPEARAALSWARRRGAGAVTTTETKEDDAPRIWWREAVKARTVARFGAALAGGAPHKAYLEKLGFPPERIFLGYDAVDNAYFARGAAEARANALALRSQYGLPERYVFACTRFIARKNIDGLLRAYGQYRQQAGEAAWGLVIAGGGEEEAACKALQAQLELSGVTWPGFVQYADLPVYFGLASAFIHPAKAEPWGLVLNEAAASGLPILSSRTVGSAYELVRDGENGALFDPMSDDDIARALSHVAGLSEAERTALGAASERIVADWGPARFGAQLRAAAQCALSAK